ncbi:DUF6049 family protein [Demequina sp. TTPB684]|uniref:DUF6049 family protein n=1 Tax=unclassified Demequina TaxID=2620311 RepID=UPI001CF5CED1|nr:MULTISPECIES: DUF6049 family protein [unclassified Demequina]MCB2413399.1 DUF6049 family protein [Demequina sp. TTPB684]UPU87963.1 DUF6049 family protein [Demequina sp. TMPB413]
MKTASAHLGRLARAAAVAVICGLAVAGAAGASMAQGGAAQTAQQVEAAVDASVVGSMPVSADPLTRLGTYVSVRAPLTDLSNVSATLTVTEAPLTSAAAINGFMEDPTGVASRAVATAPVTASSTSSPSPPGALPVGTTATVGLSVTPGGLGLPTPDWGVYGLTVSVAVDGKVVWSQASPVTWQPDLVPPLDVTVLASISGPPERVDALLAAASDERVTLLVDPSALTVRQRLDLNDREAYTLPIGNLDVTSVAHAGAPALLDAAVAESRELSSLSWIAVAAAADDATAALTTNAGAVAILADAKWAGAQPSTASVVTAEPVGEVALAPVVLPHLDLSLALASQPPSHPATNATVLALAALNAGQGNTSVVIAPGDSWVVDGTRPSQAIDALLDAPFVTATPLTAALSAPDRPAVDLPESLASEADAGSELAVGAVSALDRLSVMATAADAPSKMVADAQRAVWSSMSLPDRADPERRRAEFDEAMAQAEAVIKAVTVTSGTSLNLVSSSGQVPVTVRNDLDVPVTLRVAMMSRSPILLTKAQPTATVDAGTEATVLVPVNAVSNGDVKVTVALRNEEGQTVAVAETLRVRVRAQWGNAATGIFTAGLAVLLIAGIVRTARRGRKDTRVRPTSADDVAGASDADA